MGAGVIDCSRLRQFRTASCPRQTCYKKLERRGEERRWRRTRTRATHVYVREDVASWRGCLSRSIDTHRDRPRTLHTRLFIFISLSIGVDERNEEGRGFFVYRSSSSKNLLFTNISPSTKFISLFLCFRKLEILLLSVESKKRFGGETPVRGHNILRTGVEFFAALAATYAKSRVAILALVQPDQSLSVGPCEMWWRRRREGC